MLSPVLNMPISDSKRQRVLVASCVLYSEVSSPCTNLRGTIFQLKEFRVDYFPVCWLLASNHFFLAYNSYAKACRWLPLGSIERIVSSHLDVVVILLY